MVTEVGMKQGLAGRYSLVTVEHQHFLENKRSLEIYSNFYASNYDMHLPYLLTVSIYKPLMPKTLRGRNSFARVKFKHALQIESCYVQRKDMQKRYI